MDKVIQKLQLKTLLERKIYGYNAAAVVGISGVTLLAFKKYFDGGNNRYKRDLTGQVIIITGANTGIGLETAKEVAKAGAKVILACRDEKRGKQAENDINKVRLGSAQFMKLDLSDLSSVRQFAQQFKGQYKQLNILVNNAGVMHIPTRQLTKDGFEMTIGVNHFGHFLLTNLLLDVLKKTPQFRVINVSSLGHAHGGINLEDPNFERREYNRIEAYAQSKLANILFTQALQHRLDLDLSDGKAVSLHPGFVRTELTRNYTGILGLLFGLTKPLLYIFSKDSLQGAQTTLHCIFKDFNKLEKGEYFSDCAVKKTNNKQINFETSEKLWEVSSKLVHL